MSPRRQARRKITEMKQVLRAKAMQGELAPGEMLPSLRELASEHGLSHMMVARSLKELVDEGVLYSVPRVGTFVGHAPSRQSEYYLVLIPDNEEQTLFVQQLKSGFGEQISQRGGAVLELDIQTFEKFHAAGEVPPLSGVLDFAYASNGPYWVSTFPESAIPHVRMGNQLQDFPTYDLVSFDDYNGGRVLTQHLLELGHRKIAYLGFHSLAHYEPFFAWSHERESGWADVLKSAGIDFTGWSFHPAHDVRPDDRDVISKLMLTRDEIDRLHTFDAIIAANNQVASALLFGMAQSDTLRKHSPAVTTFDDDLVSQNNFLTALRLPWEELGRTAATTAH
jgi:DNA-binding transcriptional regulator YhcF (GntR family)